MKNFHVISTGNIHKCWLKSRIGKVGQLPFLEPGDIFRREFLEGRDL